MRNVHRNEWFKLCIYTICTLHTKNRVFSCFIASAQFPSAHQPNFKFPIHAYDDKISNYIANHDPRIKSLRGRFFLHIFFTSRPYFVVVILVHCRCCSKSQKSVPRFIEPGCLSTLNTDMCQYCTSQFDIICIGGEGRERKKERESDDVCACMRVYVSERSTVQKRYANNHI